MYHLLRCGKLVTSVETFQEALIRAKEESKRDYGVSRRKDGVWYKGCSIAVWSGPLAPYVEGGVSLRGVTQHVIFSCGFTS
jgi:hypothetical protein